jgi:PilY1 beta-propeller domain/Domain of unknown function (DUF2341)
MEMNKEAKIMKKYMSVIAFIFISLTHALSAEAVYDSWAYKIEITVNNPGSSATDYPVKINIPAKTFIEANRMNSDLSDIRFSDGTNALPFWISITENMQRQINNMPVYVKLKNFNSGTNVIYMHFDKTKTRNDSPPKADYTVGASGDYCGNGGTPASAPNNNGFPYTHNKCGDNVFSLFAFDQGDCNTYSYTSCGASCVTAASPNDWVSNVNRFIDNKSGAAPFGNSFDIYFRGHYYSNQSMYSYFLTQITPPVTSTMAGNIANYCGYRLNVSYSSASTANQTYNMGNVNLTVQTKTTNCGTSSTGWTDVATFPWHPYNNSIQDFDIRVTSANINVLINGNLIGTANRTDSWTGGHVGFDKNTWTTGPECGSNSTDGISPIRIQKYVADPTVNFYGNADLTLKRLKPTTDASYIGQDVIETIVQKQVLEDYVDGNTLEKYIYSAFPLASLETQVFKYALKVRNRGTASDTFNLTLTPTGDLSSWSIAYDYGSGLKDNLPGTGGTQTSGTLTLAAGAEQVITIYAMPSSAALFEGGKGSDNLILDFQVNAQYDFSFDNVRFAAYLKGKSGCYWKWKMPLTISYTDQFGTDDIRDYQVLVNITGVSQFSDALPNGADIIFTDSSGTKLPFWMKSFNQAAGSGAFWVKLPKLVSGSPGSTTIYIWWGNSNYITSLSDPKKTFDLWEDWLKKDSTHSWSVGDIVGCPDGSTGSPNCSGHPSADPLDMNHWKNYPTPVDSYDWWSIKDETGKLTGQALMADKGSANVTSDIGPVLAGGDVRWKSYEVLYSFYDEYENYNAGAGNPQYNPVFFQDAGNVWGMEFFAGGGNLFIFRPFGFGTDWTWTYQANAGAMLGGTFPAKNKKYYVKTKLFQNEGLCSNTLYTTKKDCINNGGTWTPLKTHVKLFVAPSTPSDVDSNASPFVEITPNSGVNGGFVSDPAFNLTFGNIGFGGWNGGFSFDDIRVRKYTEPEPACSQGAVQATIFNPVETLSSPNLTPPLLNGRPVLLTATLTPWAWTGNLVSVFADCLISGDCQSGEDPTKLGTISLWGKIDDNTPKGFGEQLKEAAAGDNNRSAINDAGWKTDGRYMYTAYDSNNDGTISCTTTTADCVSMGVSNISTLRNLFDPTGTCSNTSFTAWASCVAGGGTWTPNMSVADATNLIRFIRGQYVAGYARSDSRNMCSSGYADTCQWKLGDIVHSSPLVVGVPNMLYGDPDYSTFMDNNNSRDMVTYFGSNDGILHAVRMATYNTITKRYTTDSTATELWAFVPNAILTLLSRTTDQLHEYTVDGLFRAIDIKATTDGAYKTVLLGELRSGGQSLFAIDITDPQSPALMWEDNQGTNPAMFANMGKAWSSPALGRLCESDPCDYTSSSNRWVAIFGSGFSPKDIENLSKNAYLSIVDMETGTLIKQVKISTKPGNITTNIAVVRDSNGYIQKAYFGDYYGALWRIDLSTSTLVSDFKTKTVLDATHLLFQPADYATSDINTPGGGPQRSITSQPRIAYAGSNQFWAYFGTGVYSEYDAGYPYQRFYGLMDNVTTYTDAVLVDMTSSAASNATPQSWFVELGHNDTADVDYTGGAPDSGCKNTCILEGHTADYCNSICKMVQTSTTKNNNERVLNTPEVYGGFVFFGTYTPQNSPCGGGTSRFYSLGYKSGSYESGLMLNGTTTQVRSITISTGQGIPSNPMIFVGKSGEGQIVAAGLVNVSTGSLIKIMLNPNKFGEIINILLWREIR